MPLFSVQASERCERQLIHVDPTIVGQIQLYRQRHIKPPDFSQVTVNGISYKILGLLGESTASAYLALSPNGQKVVIKHFAHLSSENLGQMYYEITATKFYRERGHPAPEILSVEVPDRVNLLPSSESWMVKEYLEGLTLPELIHNDSPIAPGPLREKLEAAALATQTSLRQKTFGAKDQSFSLWLEIHSQSLEGENLNLAQIKKWLTQINWNSPGMRLLTRLSVHGDVRLPNLIYVPEQATWILYDP